MARVKPQKPAERKAAANSTKGKKRVKASDIKDVTAPESSELEEVLASIRKSKGESLVLPARQIPIANHIPTGHFMLDFALLGGIPEGYATMFYGLESCGKTTVIKKIVGEYQRKYNGERKVCWVDTEGMFDADWAEKLGVDTENLYVSRPDTGNEAVDVIDALMGAKETGMIILDSIPSCVPKQMVETSAEDDTMAKLAQLMGKLCARITTNWNRERRRGHHVTIIFVNQWRFKVGFVMGDNRILPAGRQINHLPTTKIELKGKEVMGEDRHGLEVVESNDHEFKITKAKHGSSVRNGECRMIHNPDSPTGLHQGDWDDTASLCTFAKRMELITGGGQSWYISGVEEQVMKKNGEPALDTDGNEVWEPKRFRILADIQAFLNDDPDEKLRLKQAVIGMQRQAKGLDILPPDGYLLSWDAAL